MNDAIFRTPYSFRDDPMYSAEKRLLIHRWCLLIEAALRCVKRRNMDMARMWARKSEELEEKILQEEYNE